MQVQSTVQTDELAATLERIALVLELGKVLHYYAGSSVTEATEKFLTATR
jgi:hypothetical protein